MSVQFWKSPKLINKPISKYPRPIRSLLKVVHKDSIPGSGPRTLDSIVSYLPSNTINSLKIQNNNTDKKFDFKNKIIYDNNLSNIENSQINNIIICISQRDFPINIHQRLLLLLLDKGIDLNHVQWVITDMDHIKEPLTLSNLEKFKKNFDIQLNEYLDYFKNEKLIKKELFNKSFNNNKDANKGDAYFNTNSELLIPDIFLRLKDFKVNNSNIHFFSNQLKWTVPLIIESLDFSSLNNSCTYVIGQTNSGKSTLIKEILKFYSNSLQNLNKSNLISNFENIDIKSSPFSSKFNVYTVPGMKIIDTPGFVRYDGGIFSHINKFGSDFLKINKMNDKLSDISITLTPRIFHSINKYTNKSGFSIGGLVFIKPWIMMPKRAVETEKADSNLEINLDISRNMFGKIEALTANEINDKMMNKQELKILRNSEWKRYIISGNNIDIILDNIGSFKVFTPEKKNQKIYWEVSIPSRVRLLSRKWVDENTVKFEKPENIKEKFSRVLGNLYEKSEFK
jgi:ABC-type dipeptide/oligopeptide/nickel transport system ATPase component